MTRGLFAVLALVLSLAASLRLPSAPRAPSVGAAPAESASPAPLLQRRAALGLGVLTAFNAAASAYDTLPEVKMDLADAEKRRKEAEGRIQKNKAEAKPYLAKISTAQKPEDFAAACDAFALYIASPLANPHFAPAMYAQLAVVDFAVSLAAVEQQLLSHLLHREAAALEDERRGLVRSAWHSPPLAQLFTVHC